MNWSGPFYDTRENGPARHTLRQHFAEHRQIALLASQLVREDEPKWYQTDWSGIDDDGQRAETFVACHLLKAAATLLSMLP